MMSNKYKTDESAKSFYRAADWLYLPLLFVVTITSAILMYRQINVPISSADSLLQWVLHDAFALFLVGFSLVLLIWQVSFAVRYKAFPSVANEQLPTMTVVIPAYNEGSQILDTVRSVMASDYPKDRLQVICVDDGSKDDTWKWINAAHQEFSGITIIKQPFNQGKRCALLVGFAKATGDVIVTIDSDSGWCFKKYADIK